MVADNQTAKIQVGDSVPVAGPQTTSSTGIVSTSVQYVDTGVILTVTPHINAGGLVNLDITQEVSNAFATDTSGLNSPTITKRSAKSFLTAQSGETMVLGGLISESKTNTSAGIPLLSSIPVIGGLFGNQTFKTQKTELIVLITPRVASTVNQAKVITEEFRKKLGEIEQVMGRSTASAVLSVPERN
jgi:general secretion pathway protein D